MNRFVSICILSAGISLATGCTSSTQTLQSDNTEPQLPGRIVANTHTATIAGWSSDGSRIYLNQHRIRGEPRLSVRSVDIASGETSSPLPLLIKRYDRDTRFVDDIKEHRSGRIVMVLNGVIDGHQSYPWHNTVALAKSFDDISDFQVIDFFPKTKDLSNRSSADRIRCRTHLLSQNRCRVGWLVDQYESRTDDVVVGFTDVDLLTGKVLKSSVVKRLPQAPAPQSIAFSPTANVASIDQFLNGNGIFDMAKELQTAVSVGDLDAQSIEPRKLATVGSHPEVHALWSDHSAIVVPAKQSGYTGLGSMEVKAIELAVIPLDGTAPRTLASKPLRCVAYLNGRPALHPKTGFVAVISIGMPSPIERVVWLDLFHIQGDPARAGTVDWHRRYVVGEHDFSDEPRYSSGGLLPSARFGPEGKLIVEHPLRIDDTYRNELILVDVPNLYAGRSL